MRNDLAANLANWMQVRKINSRQLAIASGVHASAVSRVLSGKRGASIATIQALACVLDVPLDRLLGNGVERVVEPAPVPAPIAERPITSETSTTQTELLRAILAELRAIRQRL
jgi:transcriptional regulator with XRE-family HTH domain